MAIGALTAAVHTEQETDLAASVLYKLATQLTFPL